MAMEKHAECLKALVGDYRRYSDYLESLVAQCHQRHENGAHAFDFKSMRPKDLDGLLGGTSFSQFIMEDDTGLEALGDDECTTSSNDDPMSGGGLKVSLCLLFIDRVIRH